MAVVPVGLYIAIRKRSFLILLGLLPGILNGLFWLFQHIQIIDTNRYAFLLFLAYKASLIVLIVKGEVRSLAFFLGVLIMCCLLSPMQVFLFLLLVVTGKITYLAFTQNWKILSILRPKSLIKLLWRTFLAWSPILLFAVPSFILTKVLTQYAKQKVYDNTFIDEYRLDTDKNFVDLMNYSVYDSLTKYNLDAAGHEFSQLNLNKALRVVKFHSDSLQYRNYVEGLGEFRQFFELFQSDNIEATVATNEFIINHLSQDLARVLIARFLPGRTEFELDIIISTDTYYRSLEADANRFADSTNARFQQTIDKQINESRELEAELTIQTLQKRAELTSRINDANFDFKNSLNAYTSSVNSQLQASINQTDEALQTDIRNIPVAADNFYESNVPQELVDISGGFEHTDAGLLDFGEHGFNLMKSLLRGVYVGQRVKGKASLYAGTSALSESLSARLSMITGGAKGTVKQLTESANNKITLLSDRAEDYSIESVRSITEETIHQMEVAQLAFESSMNDIQGFSDDLTQASRDATHEVYQTASKATENTLLNTYNIIYFLKRLSDLLLLIAVIKSFFYVFSRIAFKGDNDVYVDIIGQPKSFDNGIITEFGGEYSIPGNSSQTFFVSRQYFPSGRSPKISLPNYTQGVFSRLLSRNYLMNAIIPIKGSKESVDFKSMGGAEFIEWELRPGEEVVFKYADLVAFSESVKFSSHISLRISSLFLGQIKFSIAKGPGKLILKSKGNVIIGQDENQIKSVVVDRILAWQRTTRFAVDSHTNIMDMYMSGVYLKRTNDDLLIVDADTSMIKRKPGLARFIRVFFLPI